MSHDLGSQAFQGLGRLCVDAVEDCIISAPDPAGMERIEARFHGSAFDLHRHDTYAIGVTLHGVQTFRYLGATRHSLPGQIIVLHPDELHDGGAGTEDGLRYRMLYLEPSLMLDCLGGASLPFVRDGVVTDAAFCETLLSALAGAGTGRVVRQRFSRAADAKPDPACRPAGEADGQNSVAGGCAGA